MINSFVHSQPPEAIVMVRPHYFVSNPETMADNAFQRTIHTESASESAYDEVTRAVDILEAEGVTVHVFEDTSNATPDSVFPNNWFSTHHHGTLVKYPMYAPNRRQEYRQDIMDYLTEEYDYSHIVDLRDAANQHEFLEGTGSIVFDHRNKVAYAAASKRTHERLFYSLCESIGFQGVLFDAADENGIPVYHSNVLMCISSQFVMIGMDMVAPKDRERLYSLFEQGGLTVIELSHQQIRNFCGNAIELKGRAGRLLALSLTAFHALTDSQKTIIQQSNILLPLAVSTIESAGGSVRCMIAGIHRRIE
ncbi:MAG: hypothetical protein ACJA2U_002238 [Marinomonas primoryensis]|jgi:hypothetical protein